MNSERIKLKIYINFETAYNKSMTSDQNIHYIK